MSDTKIESLFREISLIKKHYEELARLTGENFNIFKILNLSTSEVRTHSAFLAELLNPNGSHNQGAVYLRLFIKKLDIFLTGKKPLHGFICDNAEVFVEKRISTINEYKTEGGNIDILIRDVSGREIVIENKIYAGDQKNQLIRYWNYNKDGILLYLNLDGHEATEYSTKDKNANILLESNKDYFVISYGDFIIEWLEECHKEASALPIIRESIQQYIHLIKSLTGKSINKVMEKEIADKIITSADNVKAAFDIYFSIETVKEKLIESLKSDFIKIANQLELLPIDQDFCKEKESYFSFKIPTSKYGIHISFGFDGLYSDFSIGVDCDEKQLPNG
jgi:hypothetical protein